MEQVGSHYTNIRAALLIYSGHSSFIKIGQKYQIFKWRPKKIYDNISPISSWKEKRCCWKL